MKFIHVADLHANKERKEEALYCLETIYKKVSVEKIDYVLFAGDFWDATITNTAASGFPEFIRMMCNISEKSKVVMISGTPMHEPFGSLDIFKTCGVEVYDNIKMCEYPDLDLLCLPEPRRSDYVKKTSKEINALIQEKYTKALSSNIKKDKPFVILYHGDVESAVYQNGFKVSTPTAISVDLLQSTNADYIACGHVHKRQELFKNCWYAGSCYPKNSGETHDCGFNLVTINNDVNVEFVSFGFPQNVTVEATVKDLELLKLKDFTNKNVLVKLNLDKSFKSLSFEKELQEIKECTNANKISVKYIYTQTQMVRSKELVEKKSIFDKFKLFQKLNNQSTTDNQQRLLNILEDQLQTESILPSDTFELEYLSLRGSLGLKDGLGVDDFEIDFNSFSDGTVAIIGNNGKGKTTIIENCHPFPQMLTRSGTLKEHFLLKDSHRILIYKTSQGRMRITMQIDAVSKGSESKYFVETEVNGEFTPVRAVDGSLASYKDFVEKTFGSLDVFLRTSFFAREQIKSVPDLSRATRSEKISLFSALAGIDYFTQVVELAKTAVKEQEEILNKLKSENFRYDSLDNEINTAKEKISTTKEAIDNILKKKEPIVPALEELTAKQKKVEQQVLLFKQNKEQYEQAVQEINTLSTVIAVHINDIENLERGIKGFEQEIEQANVEQVQKEIKEMSERKTVLKKELKTLKNKNEFSADKMTRFDTLKLELAQTENLRARNSVNCVDLSDTCPTCGQELPKDKKAQLKHIAEEAKLKDKEYLEKIASLKFERDVLEDEYKEFKKLDKTISSKTKELETLEDDLDEKLVFLAELDVEHKKFEIEKRKEQVSFKLEQLENFKKAFDKAEGTVNKLKDVISEQPEDYTLEICNLQQQLKLLEINEMKHSAELSFQQDRIKELEHEKEMFAEVLKEISDLEQNISDLQVIAKAFSNTGIPAIELESMAPEISDVTNEILAETYGDRFKVSFTTQREGSTGKKIEDFVINVFDSEKGRMKTLDLLCSGESIWIKQALFFAFSVLRSRRTGFCFRTRFMDESDGALDATGRVLYLKMIETAHKACNARLSILITHSSELKEIIEQRIEL